MDLARTEISPTFSSKFNRLHFSSSKIFLACLLWSGESPRFISSDLLSSLVRSFFPTICFISHCRQILNSFRVHLRSFPCVHTFPANRRFERSGNDISRKQIFRLRDFNLDALLEIGRRRFEFF